MTGQDERVAAVKRPDQFSPRMGPLRWLLMLVLGIVGFNCVWSGVSGVRLSSALQSRGVRGKGTVVDVVKSGAKGSSYHEVVEFTAIDGTINRFNGSAGSAQKGTSVDVIYLPEDPSMAVIASPGKSGRIDSYASAVFGLLFLAPILLLLSPQSGMNAFVSSAKWFAVLVIAGTGFAFFTWGAIVGVKRSVLLHSGTRAEGRVVDFASTGKGAVPVIEFVTRDKQKHRFVANASTKSSENARLELLYIAHDPSIAALASFDQFWLGAIVAAILGLFFLFLGALAYRFLIATKL